MHIVFVTEEYPTEAYRAGGMCWAFSKMASVMKAAGHAVSVVVPAEQDAMIHDEAGVRVWRSACRPALHKSIEAALVWRDKSSVRFLNRSEGILATLRSIHGQEGIDIIITAATQSAYLLSTGGWPLIYRFSGHPGLMTIANGLSGTPTRPARHMNDWMREVGASYADARFAPSEIVAKVYRDVLNLPVERILTPMVADDGLKAASVAGSALPARYLCYYGSLQERKGCWVFAQALPQVLDRYPDVEVVFVGRNQPAPGGTAMWTHISELLKDYMDRVHYLGVQEQASAFHIMAQAEWVVFPALFDNLPNTLLEAMLLGRPVIATSDSGHDDVIRDQVTGVSVPPGDVDALAQIIIDCLAWPASRRAELGRSAHESVVARCSPEQFVGALEPLLQSAIEKHRRGGALRRLILKIGFIIMVLRSHKYGVPQASIEKLQVLIRKYLYYLRNSKLSD